MTGVTGVTGVMRGSERPWVDEAAPETEPGPVPATEASDADTDECGVLGVAHRSTVAELAGDHTVCDGSRYACGASWGEEAMRPR